MIRSHFDACNVADTVRKTGLINEIRACYAVPVMGELVAFDDAARGCHLRRG